MEDICPTQDVKCAVGAIGTAQSGRMFPLLLADYGEKHASLKLDLDGVKGMILDVVQSEKGGGTLYVHSDKVITELTAPTIDRALKATRPTDMLTELARDATPVFSLSYEITSEELAVFQRNRSSMYGHWVLVLLASDATTILVGPDHVIVQVKTKQRIDYE